MRGWTISASWEQDGFEYTCTKTVFLPDSKSLAAAYCHRIQQDIPAVQDQLKKLIRKHTCIQVNIDTLDDNFSVIGSWRYLFGDNCRYLWWQHGQLSTESMFERKEGLKRLQEHIAEIQWQAEDFCWNIAV